MKAKVISFSRKKIKNDPVAQDDITDDEDIYDSSDSD